jgi:hypothetical protein
MNRKTKRRRTSAIKTTATNPTEAAHERVRFLMNNGKLNDMDEIMSLTSQFGLLPENVPEGTKYLKGEHGRLYPYSGSFNFTAADTPDGVLHIHGSHTPGAEHDCDLMGCKLPRSAKMSDRPKGAL